MKYIELKDGDWLLANEAVWLYSISKSNGISSIKEEWAFFKPYGIVNSASMYRMEELDKEIPSDQKLLSLNALNYLFSKSK